jgi:hypothetical protein
MSRNPDPCYCEQACVYESLLAQALAYVRANGSERAYQLAETIDETIADYKLAQKQYEEEED